jgi:transposase InsO family protein
MTTNDDVIRDRYGSPPHPTAFAGLSNLSRHWNLPSGRIRNILADSDTYTLHRGYRRPKVRNPFYVYYRRQMLQIDTVEVSQLAADNDGVKHLLVCIDCFSRFLWVRTLKTKRAREVLAALDSVFAAMVDLPRQILCDRGTEIKNAAMTTFLQNRGVEMLHTFSEVKAGIVERCNRSLQNLIYRSMTDRQSRRFVDVLPELVSSYNGRPHRSIDGLSPAEGEMDRNKVRVVSALRAHYAKAITPRVAKFKVGDLVRIKANHGHTFARGYDETFTSEIFVVSGINTRMGVLMYHVVSDDTGEVVEGGLYSNELALVGKNHPFKVEKVLKRRTLRGQRQIFVKWLHYSDRHNCWIPAANVTRTYNNNNNNG